MKKSIMGVLAVISLVMLLGAIVSCKKAAVPAGGLSQEKAMSQNFVQEKNKQIARDFFAAIDKQDFSRLQELLPSDFTLTDPGPGTVCATNNRALKTVRG